MLKSGLGLVPGPDFFLISADSNRISTRARCLMCAAIGAAGDDANDPVPGRKD